MNIYIIQFINYTLSFFMWMILGRVILTLMLGGRQNVVTGIFAKITDPVYRITRKILPFAKESCVPAYSVFIILIIRFLMIIIFKPGAAPH
jgi:YggT family protein